MWRIHLIKDQNHKPTLIGYNVNGCLESPEEMTTNINVYLTLKEFIGFKVKRCLGFDKEKALCYFLIKRNK